MTDSEPEMPRDHQGKPLPLLPGAVVELEWMIHNFQGDIDEYGKGVYDLWERLIEDDDLFTTLKTKRTEFREPWL